MEALLLPPRTASAAPGKGEFSLEIRRVCECLNMCMSVCLCESECVCVCFELASQFLKTNVGTSWRGPGECSRTRSS
jgi:uncharacterized protein YllA (UPF0747 family)